MRILIYGAGQAGSYLAGHLALAGHDVTLAHEGSVPPSRLTLYRQHGSTPRTFELHIAGSLRAALEREPYAWIGLAAPAYETATVAYTLADDLHNTTPVVSFQTGIGSEVTLSAVLGTERVVGGCLTATLDQPTPDTLLEVSPGGVCLAGSPATLPVIVDSLANTDLHVETFADITRLKWSKLFVDIIGNALPAILDLPPVEVYRDYRLFDIEWASLREALWVLDHTNIELANLPGAPARGLATLLRRLPRQFARPVLLRYLHRQRGNTLPPLLSALRAGSQHTEIAWLNGAIVYHAQGIQRLAPINHALALTVSDIAAGRVPWDTYRRSPDLLLKTIHLAQGQTR